ncbi:serine/threonine protein kinase [Nocardioides sp. WL0053]|uniref:non-specific serine/threonine protein kinase n=1 Tax=Nocardioides jiangsuensis TaxID=2866161 RepID=A0ABS7RNX5_9ACTN|nr:serine/threonine-protein kinase [Nocardioides jiangsuensis]MBY9076756.1 serine/threonine protein kinase [Nocardioides jiangsuensis]
MSPELIAGRYRVERAVGRGGMGTVWLCQDEVLGRDVAVKNVGNLPDQTSTDVARAMREARSSAALNHPNVVSVFDVVETGDEIWMVMEYFPSRTLSEILREDGPLSPERAARIGVQVADGLAAAHARGTIHRDVKPGNVLVGAGDQAKISDFGIARMAGDPQLTSTGLLTGTPSYFSPELARGADPGPESDVWALGATLYAAVEGASPYPTQRNPIALLQTIASEPPPRPSNAGPLAEPIARMMDRDPRSRWAMADAAHALRRVAERGRERTAAATVPLATDDAHDPTTTTSRPVAAPVAAPPERRRRKGLLPWLLVAAALLLVAGAGYALLDLNGDATAGQTQGTSTPTPSETQGASPKRSPSPSPTPTPSPEQTPSKTPKPAPAPDTAEAKADFVDGYFDVMPEDTDTGWSMLAPSMQSVGKDEYEDFWGSIESVESSQTSASSGSDTVSTVITYTFDDGRVVTEQQEIDLQGSDGAYAIADDRVISSQTQ